MPIDPRRFKKVITNHFDNLTEEDFLKTLQKSSPHLFDKNSEQKHDIQLSDRYEVTFLNIITRLSPISSPETDTDFVAYLKEKTDRMKLDNTNSFTIRVYVIKSELEYTLGVIFQSTRYLVDKATNFFTKRA